MNKLGALWKRKSKDGSKTFLTGKIGETEVIIFLNKSKNQPKHPDYEVFESEPRSAPVQKPIPPPEDEFGF
jgi:hypothetical protein